MIDYYLEAENSFFEVTPYCSIYGAMKTKVIFFFKLKELSFFYSINIENLYGALYFTVARSAEGRPAGRPASLCGRC